MTPALIDSDVLIEVLRGRNEDIAGAWSHLIDSSAPLFISPVSVAEIWAGARKNEHEAISAMFGAIETVAINLEIAELAGRYLRLYRASHGTELGDALIAATASVHGLYLWTRNRKHFPMRDVNFLKT